MRSKKKVQSHKKTVKKAPSVLFACVAFLLATLVITLPFILMMINGQKTKQADALHDREAAAIGLAQRRQQWNRAVAYNKRLYASGQPVLGKMVDPFSGTADVKENRDYLSQLTLPPDGIMSVIRYPRLGINLPVRHGTDSDTLLQGAGHLYGTSLPVGGRNTHTVISAHSGMEDKIMFDRLDGLGGVARKGDVFYLSTLGRSLAYRVVNIRVVSPTEFKYLRIVPGKDLATLLTCTPYGVNTMRLLVTGIRTKMPKQARLPQNEFDWTLLWWILGILAVWLLISLSIRRIWKRN